DPGVIFIDEINRHNPTPGAGRIEATNPCAEQPLLPFESCNLGSINLSKMVDGGKIDWGKLRKTVRIAVHFLDNVIDANKFPFKEIEAMTKSNRKIGLGVMGWADMLIKLGIPYNSERAVALGERLMQSITQEARKMSEELGKKRGSFPNFRRSTLAKKYSAMRNASVTTIAPTGSISIIAGCSSGIEPLFAVSFIRKHILGEATLFEVNPIFERMSKEKGFYNTKLLEKIAKSGSLQKIKEVGPVVRKLFVTALDIAPEWHVKMQAAFQKHTDNAVSKTVNLPHNARVSDVKKVYELAWKLKCKGITVYRYGSRAEQVLYIGELERKLPYVTAEAEYAGGCPTGICPVPR
ncbi:MAG: adenosylcobalamin-dependent ribonucleoside-diphosphate reductase, partial [Candidatus Aenigmatarchaeota archaeon]